LSNEFLRIFKEVGAVKEGHFLLTSGLHSPIYWEKFRILQYPHHTSRLCQFITNNFIDQKIELVVGPMTGGIILAFETARQLGVMSAFAEKEGQILAFRRDFIIAQGERVLVVDDVMTTGGSVWDTIKAVSKFGGTVVGVGLLVDRSENKVDFGVPTFSCIHSPAITYNPDKCPLCASQIPLIKPGSQS
jgi:orotate phosphoribosyltransferase